MLSVSEYFLHPKRLAVPILMHFGSWIPDKYYLKLIYRLKMGRKLDLEHPKRYTEKLQWLKLYDRKDEYTTIVDKYAVKEYITNLIGNEYIIPTIGVWDKPESINWDLMPNQFVLKTTNGGGGTGVIICRDKSNFDFTTAVSKLKNSMKINLYHTTREWPYKNVIPRIIAEKYLEDDSGELRDYKFYCFNGVPKVMLLASERFSAHNFNYYDMDFHQLPINSAVGGKSSIEFKRPDCFEEMKKISRSLCQNFAHVRVDLYYSNNKIYFGELTLFDSSGYDNFNSDEEDLRWGSWLNLPKHFD